jgi:ABC-type multidrug transport system ATPase subunit
MTAGKTTTLRMLGTLIETTSGSAVVACIPLAPGNAVEIRQRIAGWRLVATLFNRERLDQRQQTHKSS